MKVLIAIVMFAFGILVGLLVTPAIQEFSSTMYVEEEYSAPRLKTMLRSFGITLPLEAADINVFHTQNGATRQVWVKFECPPDVKEDFIERLRESHQGLFNRVIPTPKMSNGMGIPWWTFQTTYQYYEFRDMCAAYDDFLRNMYLYAILDGTESPSNQEE